MGKTLVAVLAEVPVETIDNEYVWVHVLPLGTFTARDGRPGTLDVPATAWVLTEAGAQEVILRWSTRKTPLVIDYEHQTYETKENGQPAPAAGWIHNLELRAQGLFAQVQWTVRAKEYIRSGEYKFISPTFLFDSVSGEVLELCSAALTNNPALDGLEPVTAKTSIKTGTFSRQKNLGHTNTKSTQGPFMYNGVSLKGVSSDVLRVFNDTQIQIEHLKDQVNALRKKEASTQLKQEIEKALCDGRLHFSCKDWAHMCLERAPEILDAFLKNASPIAALMSMQTRHATARTQHSTEYALLTKEEEHVCSQLGMSVATFIKNKKECQ